MIYVLDIRFEKFGQVANYIQISVINSIGNPFCTIVINSLNPLFQ